MPKRPYTPSFSLDDRQRGPVKHRPLKALVTTLWVALVLLLPNIVWACPYCAGRNDGSSVARGIFITSMVALPFLVVGVAYGVIRRSGLFQSEHTPTVLMQPDASKKTDRD